MATCFTYFFVINNAFQYLSNVKWCRLIRATVWVQIKAGLTIRHGTHVRRAPSWKGAPE